MSGGQIMPGFSGHIKDLRFYSVMRTHQKMFSRDRVGFMGVESRYYV